MGAPDLQREGDRVAWSGLDDLDVAVVRDDDLGQVLALGGVVDQHAIDSPAHLLDGVRHQVVRLGLLIGWDRVLPRCLSDRQRFGQADRHGDAAAAVLLFEGQRGVVGRALEILHGDFDRRRARRGRLGGQVRVAEPQVVGARAGARSATQATAEYAGGTAQAAAAEKLVPKLPRALPPFAVPVFRLRDSISACALVPKDRSI